MFNNKLYLLIIYLLLPLVTKAQDCDVIVKGQVIDEVSELPLSFVNVFAQEISEGAVTDDDGFFEINNICKGAYHFIFSHIGCESVKFHVDVEADTLLLIRLSHTATSLGTIIVEGQKDYFNDQPKSSVNRQSIEDNSNQNLSGLIENETGVHLIKNGSGISKPVVHGLYGNRLLILNNGIIQSGQQWGNDHSPEIDPYAADKITVLKGASSIEFGGGGLGSIILVEPKRIEKEPHLHGQVNYIYDSNGRGHTLSSRIEKYSSLFAWRINGTLKNYGDKRSSDYFLNNTGVKEANLSLQLEKSFKDNLFFEFYLSTYNTTLGILRGSHIGNLTDLEAALTNQIPFFTEPDFSYSIEAPKQNVSHHLAKLKSKYFINEDQSLEIVVAGQINDRKEFDVRRSGRADIPALGLNQSTINAEFKYVRKLGDHYDIKVGLQNIITDNSNNSETGILPLIPDYLSWKSGVFSTFSRRTSKTQFNIGVRYDFEDQNVVAISDDLPRRIVRYNNQYQNLNGLMAFKFKLASSHSIGISSGFSMRNPAINELYSRGLHQGVSGIEEGDVNLSTEKALKNTIEYQWLPSANFSLNAVAYHQRFGDYIYLNPQDEIRLTVRGAFPVFKYEQTDASIYGLDISSQFTIGDSFFGLVKYSYLRGEDNKNDTPLIFMPPNRFFGSLIYRAKKSIKISDQLKLEETEIEINNKLVFEQKNILLDQDFVQPPPLYNLFGVKLSTNLILSNYKIRCFVKVDNLFNTKYRDYLNRQRYFADDLGIGVSVGISLRF